MTRAPALPLDQLLPAARWELQLREREAGWPIADTTAWRAIVAILEGGARPVGAAWAPVVGAVAIAEQRAFDRVIALAADDPRRGRQADRAVALAHLRRQLARAAHIATGSWFEDLPPTPAKVAA